MQCKKKNFQELTIKDGFMFAAVMSDETECRKFLTMALEMEILKVHVITEKSLTYHPEYHGVRLAVLAVENGTNRRFNVEMQVRNEADLPKRSRYYHSQMDMDALLAGETYASLPDTYVIFICDFDPFGHRLYRYTFHRVCDKTGLLLNDGQTTIFLSTKGQNASKVSDALVRFLNYVGHPEAGFPQDDLYLKELNDKIQSIKHDRNLEDKYMLLEIMLAEAKSEGKTEGRLEGQERVNELNRLLIEQNRSDDIIKASSDSEYQEKLFKEFNL